jgi:hypothetical protein
VVETTLIGEKKKPNELKSKGGAPKKKVRRESIMRIRMTAAERFLIVSKAKTAGMPPSSWIRAAAKSAKIVPRLTAEEGRILWMLSGLANNFNKVTKRAHQLGLLKVVRDCDSLLKEIDVIFKKLNNNDRESDNR